MSHWNIAREGAAAEAARQCTSTRKPGDRPWSSLVAMRRALRRRSVLRPFACLSLLATPLPPFAYGSCAMEMLAMQYRFPVSHTLALAIALALPATAFAAADATDLDKIVVTGTRTEVPLQDSLLPVQVIDREEIQRSQASSLQDLLKGRAGIGFSNQGGLGKLGGDRRQGLRRRGPSRPASTPPGCRTVARQQRPALADQTANWPALRQAASSRRWASFQVGLT